MQHWRAVLIKVMLVEDQIITRMGLEMLISSQSELSVVSKVENGMQAVETYQRVRPDVVLMDIKMPVMDGLEASRRIKEFDKNAKIIILSGSDSFEEVFEAFALGANGYCMKDTSPTALIESIKTAYCGGLSLDPRIAKNMLHFVAARDALPVSENPMAATTRLNLREEEVLNQLVSGLTSEQMTVSTKLSVINILNKMVAISGHAHTGAELRPTVDPVITASIREKFEFIEPIAQGGMGIIFKAQQRQSGKMLAVKVLRDSAFDVASRQRFIREASIMSCLAHPNIVAVQDFLVDPDGTAYLIMELIDGLNLCDVLDCGGAFVEHEAVPIFVQCLEALEYLHSSNVVHRDIKPSNIILYSENSESIRVKIADFGIAKQNVSAENQLTIAGEIFGSPLYMSPEQAKGEDLDERSDIYSFGCVMYEVLTGSPPFVGSNSIETMAMHVKDPVPDLDSFATPHRRVSPGLKRIVMRCLAKFPRDRPQSATEVLGELNRARKPSVKSVHQSAFVDNTN